MNISFVYTRNYDGPRVCPISTKKTCIRDYHPVEKRYLAAKPIRLLLRGDFVESSWPLNGSFSSFQSMH